MNTHDNGERIQMQRELQRAPSSDEFPRLVLDDCYGEMNDREEKSLRAEVPVPAAKICEGRSRMNAATDGASGDAGGRHSHGMPSVPPLL